MKVGDKVSNPDFPGHVGHIDRIVYVSGNSYYSVIWPWRASPGPNIMYAVANNPLKKV